MFSLLCLEIGGRAGRSALLLEPTHELTGDIEAVVKTWAVRQGSDGLEASKQPSTRVSNLIDEGLAVTQREWCRERQCVGLLLDDERQIEPREHLVGDTTVEIDLLSQKDGSAIAGFIQKLPAHDLLFVRRDLSHPKVIVAWLDDTQVDAVGARARRNDLHPVQPASWLRAYLPALRTSRRCLP